MRSPLLKMLFMLRSVVRELMPGRVRMAKRSPYSGERLLTVDEVAELMRVSNMTVYRLIKAGHLAALRVGKNYRIREDDVNRYLADRTVRVTGA